MSVGGTVSAPLGPRYLQGELGNAPFLWGPVGLDLGHGVAGRDPGDPGFRIGVHVPAPPLGILASQIDVYAQAPEGWLRDWDHGAGISWSPGHIMPYLQLGRMGERNSGWYTTQGINFLFDRIDQPAGVLWVPEIAYQWRTGERTIRIFATGGIGKRYAHCVLGPHCLPTTTRQALAVGAALQVHRRPRDTSSR